MPVSCCVSGTSSQLSVVPEDTSEHHKCGTIQGKFTSWIDFWRVHKLKYLELVVSSGQHETQWIQVHLLSVAGPLPLPSGQTLFLPNIN